MALSAISSGKHRALDSLYCCERSISHLNKSPNGPSFRAMRSTFPSCCDLRIQEWTKTRCMRLRWFVCSLVIAWTFVGCDRQDSDETHGPECDGWKIGVDFGSGGFVNGRVVSTWTLTRESPKPKTFIITTDEDLSIICQKANEAVPQKRSIELRGLGVSSEHDALQESILSSTVAFDHAVNHVLFRDLDGDGQKDLVLVLDGENAVTVVRAVGINFLAPVTFAAGINPVMIRTADMNGDGKVDLLTVNLGKLTGNDYVGGDVSLLLGNGDGTFQAPISIAAGKVPRDLGSGDFNEDGKLDLVIADTPYTSGHQLLLRLGNGDGTFQPPAVIQTQTADSLDVVDLNPDVDDHDDIVTNGSILFGRGDGTFAPAVKLPIGADMKLDVARVGDLNGDSKPDIVVASSQSQVVSVFLGNGDGALRPPHHYPIDGPADQIEITDLNHDRFLDVEVSNGEGGGARLIGNGDGTFQAPELYAAGGAADTAVADFTGDGVPDLVVANSSGYIDGGAVLLKGLGGGRFGPPVAIPGHAGSRVATGDWNGDNKQDLVFTLDGDGVAQKPHVVVALGNGDGTFTSSTQINLPGDQALFTFFCTPAFVNADKAPDLLVANPATGEVAVLLGDGKGGLSAQPSVPIGLTPNGIVSGDMNGDGKLDIVVIYQGKFGALDGGVKVALGNGDGTFRPPQTLRTNVAPNSIARADFNGDGKLDFAIALQQFGWDVEIFLGNGDGTFAVPEALGLTENLISGVVVADVDLDGKPDLAVSEGSSRMLGFRGKGDGTFELALSAVKGGKRGEQMLAADVDHDGLPDMVSALGNGFVAVYRNPLADAGPSFNLLRVAGKIELTWPGIFKGFSLKEADTLSSPLWIASTNVVNLLNNQFHAVIEIAKKSRFYRLEKSQ